MRIKNRAEIAEFGDFQTPPKLALQVCELLSSLDISPASIVEPTCGVGNFLYAAANAFPQAQRAIGIDVDPSYVLMARQRGESEGKNIDVFQGDFFAIEWEKILKDCDEPVLAIGNPPWVTNTHLSKLGSNNAPVKSNGAGLSGYDAISGKSNFDISEWMLNRLLDRLNGRRAILAMLCKTAVARKVLTHAWRSGIQVESARIHLIDARESFGAAVEACLLVCIMAPASHCDTCSVFPSLLSHTSDSEIGYIDGQLIADVGAYRRWHGLCGPERYRWRSGVKHDCSAVMELTCTGNGYVNGLGDNVEIEDDYLFPLFKSSDIANNRISAPARYALVPQRKVGDDTRIIQHVAPRTWGYLESHADRLADRRSAIYLHQPRFSVFGVGDYTFAPWKVAVSGLYKQIAFRVVPPFAGKPSVLDDTCYFLACDSEEEAEYLASLLGSETAHEFYRTFLFPDAKRPVTVELLRRLDLLALARVLGSGERVEAFLDCRNRARKYGAEPAGNQHVLFA